MENANNSAILINPVSTATCPKCGAMLDVEGLPAFTLVQCVTCTAEFQVPAKFGSFMLLQLLGAGGMGGVYRAHDEGLNREVAIKVMLKSLGDDPQFVTTFQHEAQAAARLNHTNIAQIYSFGQENGQPYIVMELISGGSLDRKMTEQGPMDPTRVMRIGLQIAEGLQEAAENGLVHGDIKPENILFDLDQNAKLVDFGLSAMACGPDNDVWGTPYYIAPEKVRRQKSDFRSDIYSLGGTLYHAITGVPPFDGTDATAVVKARFDGPAKPIREIRTGVPAEIETVIGRMLEMEPQKRYPTYGSLLGDMRRYLAKAGPVKLDKKNKIIMIKGKRETLVTDDAGTAQSSIKTAISRNNAPPRILPASAITEDFTASDTTVFQRVQKALFFTLMGIILLGGLFGIIVFGFKQYREKQQHEYTCGQIQKSQTTALASIKKSVEIAQVTFERTKQYASESMITAVTAANAVVTVFGESIRDAMIPPDQSVILATDVTNVTTVVMATNAIVTMTNTVETVSQSSVPDAVSSNVHPVVSIVRGMYVDAFAVRAAALLASNIVVEIATVAREASIGVQLDKATTEVLVQKANSLVENVKNMGQNRQISEAPRKVSQLKRTLESVKTDVASLHELKRQEALEQARKIKADEVAEQKRLAQEAYAQKISVEISRIKEVELANVDLLRQLQFRETLRAIKDIAEKLETSEAQRAAALAVERINRIKDFHAYLVQNVVGFKSGRGWSIDEADNKNILVAGRKILWTEIYVNRMDIVGELINSLIMNEQAVKGLRLRERTRLRTNAALCLYLFYKTVPSAQERAKKIANDAAQQFNSDAESIKQLLPEFF